MLDVAKPRVKEYDAAVVYQELAPLIGRLIRIRKFERLPSYSTHYYSDRICLTDYTGELRDANLVQTVEGKTQLTITVGKKDMVLNMKDWIGVYQRDSNEWRVIHEPLSISIDSAQGFEKKKENTQ